MVNLFYFCTDLMFVTQCILITLRIKNRCLLIIVYYPHPHFIHFPRFQFYCNTKEKLFHLVFSNKSTSSLQQKRNIFATVNQNVSRRILNYIRSLVRNSILICTKLLHRHESISCALFLIFFFMAYTYIKFANVLTFLKIAMC